jgi:hypothetical protein
LLAELGAGEFEIVNDAGDIIAVVQDVSTNRFNTTKFADDFPRFYEDYSAPVISRKINLVSDSGGAP